VSCWRGSEQDVLDRYFGAAQATGAEVIVRVTSDCPLFDGALLDDMLAVFQRAGGLQPPSGATNHATERRLEAAGTGLDYLSNVQARRFPRGLDAEIFTFAALTRAHLEASRPHEREHVTPYFYQHPELFRLHSFEGREDWSAHRWTLDTPEDWQFVEAVYAALGAAFTTADVLKLLKAQPELARLNAHVEQKRLAP
jgi:spore coat polysaccharide biosynthesis protein SpsF